MQRTRLKGLRQSHRSFACCVSGPPTQSVGYLHTVERGGRGVPSDGWGWPQRYTSDIFSGHRHTTPHKPNAFCCINFILRSSCVPFCCLRVVIYYVFFHLTPKPATTKRQKNCTKTNSTAAWKCNSAHCQNIQNHMFAFDFWSNLKSALATFDVRCTSFSLY